MRRLPAALVLLLAACGPIAPAGELATRALTGAEAEPALAQMKRFGPPQVRAPQVSNNDLAIDVLDLAMTLESGRALPVLTRFEGPIRVRVTGAPPPSLGPDLARLLERLRREAGIDITSTRSTEAEITVEAVPRNRIRRALPDAACFVVPNVSSLRDYMRLRRSDRVRWTTLRTRERIAVFVPSDASPQELRDCLHEELAQAIGPLSDLYRLPDSVFNDDNVHTVLTGYDMLVLRILYHPQLRSGMTRAEVSAALPAILAELNPGGERLPPVFAGPTPQTWARAVETALGPGALPAERRAAAARALAISGELGWQDHRRAFAHYAAGRQLQASDPARALGHFRQADAIYARTPATALHRAYVAAQIAANAVSQGDGSAALRALDPHLGAAREAENAALLATLLLLRAEALELEGRAAEARAARLDSLGWARYGFGPDWAVRAKLREVAALNPRTARG